MLVYKVTNVHIENLSSEIEIHCMQPCGECHHSIDDLANEKCAPKIWIPSRHTTTTKGDKIKAMELFVEEIA